MDVAKNGRLVFERLNWGIIQIGNTKHFSLPQLIVCVDGKMKLESLTPTRSALGAKDEINALL